MKIMGYTIIKFLKILPHIPRHIWNILWIREDEFHKSLNMDTNLIIRLDKEHTNWYINNLLHRRKIAHERGLKKDERAK